jgi:serine/threonine protein kinase
LDGTLKPGDEIGNYELVAHLKHGGMATLFLARRKRPADNRIFAIKLIHPHMLDDEQLVTMFRDEVGLTIRIRHPNVVAVEEVGEANGHHFLVMEYIHGCSLAQLLQALIRKDRRMTPSLATYVAMCVAEGLHAAHETRGPDGKLLNVVHRDVSPQNILLSHTGEIKLIDFGIAKSRMRMHHSVAGSAIKGKLRYMAPEHAAGASVDRRTDVYALGIVLWEMLTMRPLFWAQSDIGVLDLVRSPKIEPPSLYASKIPPALDSMVLQALAVRPNDRPATAAEFRDALSEAVPFAEALDEDQVAELLHSMVGAEMDREKSKIGDHVVLALGAEADHPRGALSEEVIGQLTSPGVDSHAFGATLEEEEAEGIDLVRDAGEASRVRRSDKNDDFDDDSENTELMNADAMQALLELGAMRAPRPGGKPLIAVPIAEPRPNAPKPLEGRSARTVDATRPVKTSRAPAAKPAAPRAPEAKGDARPVGDSPPPRPRPLVSSPPIPSARATGAAPSSSMPAPVSSPESARPAIGSTPPARPSPSTWPPPSTPPASAPERSATTSSIPAGFDPSVYDEPPPKESNLAVIIGVGFAILLLGGAAVVFFLL